eukprot:Cvel_35298.t1-p1 / transcript=Cvel_35298.t1 / gene=Cvel_35298 / organism=Chromera_velia_CCMP2878 / gene_product=hypothetical protein / transcript_product=hypothetical protein / location=Cvel_scaffold6391:15-2458(+) / protein_length=608 / sequence_SO=supercontig / SO=protein_coding / is_pseudo=false
MVRMQTKEPPPKEPPLPPPPDPKPSAAAVDFTAAAEDKQRQTNEDTLSTPTRSKATRFDTPDPMERERPTHRPMDLSFLPGNSVASQRASMTSVATSKPRQSRGSIMTLVEELGGHPEKKSFPKGPPRKSVVLTNKFSPLAIGADVNLNLDISDDSDDDSAAGGAMSIARGMSRGLSMAFPESHRGTMTAPRSTRHLSMAPVFIANSNEGAVSRTRDTLGGAGPMRAGPFLLGGGANQQSKKEKEAASNRIPTGAADFHRQLMRGGTADRVRLLRQAAALRVRRLPVKTNWRQDCPKGKAFEVRPSGVLAWRNELSNLETSHEVVGQCLHPGGAARERFLVDPFGGEREKIGGLRRKDTRDGPDMDLETKERERAVTIFTEIGAAGNKGSWPLGLQVGGMIFTFAPGAPGGAFKVRGCFDSGSAGGANGETGNGDGGEIQSQQATTRGDRGESVVQRPLEFDMGFTPTEEKNGKVVMHSWRIQCRADGRVKLCIVDPASGQKWGRIFTAAFPFVIGSSGATGAVGLRRAHKANLSEADKARLDLDLRALAEKAVGYFGNLRIYAGDFENEQLARQSAREVEQTSPSLAEKVTGSPNSFWHLDMDGETK